MTLQEKMEHQLDERTRDMRNMLESCQTKVTITYKNMKRLEMWANAQRDAPLPNIGGALCSTPQFGCRPLLECRAVTLPRRETR